MVMTCMPIENITFRWLRIWKSNFLFVTCVLLPLFLGEIFSSSTVVKKSCLSFGGICKSPRAPKRTNEGMLWKRPEDSG